MADRIRKINSQTGDVHVVIKTGDLLPANAAISGISVSANGTIYATDYVNQVVYKVFEDGRVSGALVGKIGVPGDRTSDGIVHDGNYARLYQPHGIAVDASDNIYVSCFAGNKVYRISPSGRCQTLAGTGVAGDACNDNGLLAQFRNPAGLCVDKAGTVFLADAYNYKIKKIWSSGKVTSLAGKTGGGLPTNGNGANAVFSLPVAVCAEPNGTLYVADWGAHRIRKIDEAGNVITLAGSSAGRVDGLGNAAKFNWVYDICVDRSGTIFVLDADMFLFGTGAIRRVTTAGVVTTLMAWTWTTNSIVPAMAMDNSGFLYILDHA